MKNYRATKKKLQSKKWIERRLRRLYERSQELRTFEQFECEPFFRGLTVATKNREYYEKAEKKNNRQIKFLEEILNKK